MSNIRIMNQNYVDSTFFTGMTYSSQLTIAPASNIQNRVRRTKVWRSAGQWEITSSNNKIVFQETIGVNLTASITVATYSTDSTFLTAIKTAMQAVGSSTYTITRDSTTNKITITSNGSGGGGVLRLITTDVNFTSASIIGYSTASDYTGALFYVASTLKIHTSEWLRFDLGSGFNPKAFILIGLRNTSIKLSDTATIKLQGNSADVWTSPSYETTIAYNDTAISAFGTTGLHTSALRYWRLYIVDASNVNGYVEISNIYLGDFYSPTQGAVQFPLASKYVDLGTTTFSESGNGFSDIRQQTQEYSLDWKYLNKTEIESLDDFIQLTGSVYPFFISMDPDGVFSSSSNRYIRYVKLKDAPSYNLDLPNLFSSNWSLREEL